MKINQHGYKGRCQMNVLLGKLNKSTHTKEKKSFKQDNILENFIGLMPKDISDYVSLILLIYRSKFKQELP